MDLFFLSSFYRFVGNGNVVFDIYLLCFLVFCFNVGCEFVGLLVGVVDWEIIVIDMNSEISLISCGNVC